MKSKVYIYRCDGYDKNKLKQIINDFFKNAIFKGKKVLLKPNMLQAHSPEANVTTHPAVVEAVAEVVMDNGGNCWVGDSPSGWGMENARHCAEKSGMLSVCKNLGIEFDFFDGQEVKEVAIKDGKIYKKIHLPESYFSYDIVINIPKLKTHSLTVFTLGVKNMLGVVGGLAKVGFHKKATHPEKFAIAICDLYSVVRPDFTILDAIEGMEGSGPVTGRTVKLNRIFASDNTNGLDAVVERMCHVDPMKIPITREVFERGLGEIDEITVIKKYNIIKQNPSNAIIKQNPSNAEKDTEFKNFKKPVVYFTSSIVPTWMLDILSPFLSRIPQVKKNLCTACKKCFEVCPVGAIDFSKNYPVFNKKKCILCFCCAERCNERLITEKKNFLVKFINTFG